MYVRLKTSKKAKHSTIQIVHGVRVGKKVKQKVIASLGVIKSKKDLIKLSKLAENLILRLEKEGLTPELKVCMNEMIHKETTYDGFKLAVDQLMQLTNFSKVTQKAQGKKTYNIEEIIKLIITQRLDLPSSKLRTHERQNDHGFQNIELHHIYRTMDAIAPLKEGIQKQAFDIVCTYSDLPMDCFFFDVTTLYFESVAQDEIKDFGFSKDQKYHSVQIVLALVVDSQGMPLAYDIFKGNLAETKTLIPVLESLRKRFSIKNVTIVCDRGMASSNNIIALQDLNFNYVIATKLRSISRKNDINDLSFYNPLPNQASVLESEKILFRTMPHPQYKEATLIVTYSPKRAHKDKKDRDRLIEKLKDKISNPSSSSSIKKVISNGGYKKFTNVKKDSLLTINEQAIKHDETWDGFHGIAVSNKADLTPQTALRRYKNLWHVEETFRIAKSTLKTRPIFHWTSSRIEAHMLLCFMTLFFERFLELLLRKDNNPLAPDRIRYALAGVHSVVIEGANKNKTATILSKLSSDAEKIFKALNISLDRKFKQDVVTKF